MNENLIDVLIFIYENYMEEDSATTRDQLLLEEELSQAGFAQGEIKKAFTWLDELTWRQGSMTENAARSSKSIRVYDPKEQQRINLETQGMLLHLEHIDILDPISRELVIERAMALDIPELDVDDVEWIVLLVLLNQPGLEQAFALMEELIYNGNSELLH